ncbi:MAG: VOC family protein, partial [Pseudomonadota bacterium]
MLNRIHHINFVVHDLDQGINLYEKLGLGPFLKDTLKKRDALTARTRIGDSWLVLVQPTDAQGAPGRHLAEHGEGFFLISFETDDLNEEKSRLSGAGVKIDTPNKSPGRLKR